jgi:hypothetical protein
VAGQLRNTKETTFSDVADFPPSIAQAEGKDDRKNPNKISVTSDFEIRTLTL